MTKPRAPMSIDAALARIAGHLPGGWGEMAIVAGRTEPTVRAWGDPGKPDAIPLPCGVALDVAYRKAGGLGAPLFDAYGIAGPIGWADAVVSWNAHVGDSLGERTFARYVCSLRQLRPQLDPLSVQEISADAIKDLIKSRRRAGVKNATIRRDLTALSSVLGHAADEGWIDENPAAALNRRRLVPERVVRIVLPQTDAIAQIFAKLPPRIRDMCELTREIGLRLDEEINLRHTAVDRPGRLITIENGKGSRVRTVTLTDAALRIIDRQPRYIGKPWVFWKDDGARFADVSSRIGGYMRRAAHQAAQTKAEFQSFSHHDFRHLFAVEYLRDGRGSIYDLQGELGHSTIAVTERYLAFLTPEQARAAKSTVAQRGAHEQRSGGSRST